MATSPVIPAPIPVPINKGLVLTWRDQPWCG